jgi:chemotaxis protein methyltransferase CheR
MHVVPQGPARAGVAELSAACGLPLRAFRPEHLRERIDRALGAEELDDVAALALRLRHDARARARFRRSVAVSHSGLFRDPHQFEALEQRLLPPMLARRRGLRVWSAGCAAGLELWTMAVILDRLGALDESDLLGSDLLQENIDLARAGMPGGLGLPPSARSRLRWECRDLVAEAAPGGAWDCILCRNVAIYLEPAAKERLHHMLAGALADRGVLVLGRSERLARPAALGLVRVEVNVYERAA